MPSHCYSVSIYESWEHKELMKTVFARHRREIMQILGCTGHVAQALAHGKRTRHYEHVLIKKCDRDPVTHQPQLARQSA